MRAVRENAGAYDFLLVLLHGGSEHHPYPSPRLLETCRFLVEEGAGAVICQHSHCVGCHEHYRGAPIVYGQGNLVFDEYPVNVARSWCEGMLVQLEVEKGAAASMEMLPYEQCGERTGVHRLSAEEASRLLDEVKRRSEEIQDEAVLEARWRQFCRDREAAYLGLLHGYGSLMHRLHCRLGWLRRFYTRRKRLVIYDLVRCEAHREVIETLTYRGSQEHRGR